MDGTDDIDDLNLSSEEATKLQNAFQNKEFLKLFQEYVENVNNPESKILYEEEIVAIEQERGYDVKFIHPEPLYVMKFVTDETKLFINICKNQYVSEATYERKNSGTEWQIPIILSKPREDFDKKKSKCIVIDVMFHPKTMEISAQNPRFKHIVEDTAKSTVEKQFKINNLKDVKYPKLKYKGTPPSLILRRNPKEGLVCEPLKDYCRNLIAGKKSEFSKTMNSSMPLEISNQIPKIPQYSIKYRDVVDMADFSLMGYTDKAAPKAILVIVQLPEVVKATEIELDISGKKLNLKSKSEAKHNYQLDLCLSYTVDKDSSTAKFEKTSKTLNITLPVKSRDIPRQDDTTEN